MTYILENAGISKELENQNTQRTLKNLKRTYKVLAIVFVLGYIGIKKFGANKFLPTL